MSRFWSFVIHSCGLKRFHSFPILIALNVAAPVYQAISKLNLRNRESRRSRQWRARLVSIGNVSVGGTGKTPLTIWLAEYFQEHGKTVAIVHGGFGRESKEIIIRPAMMADKPSTAELGDEAAMMANRLPNVHIAVGSDKKEATIRVETQLSPDIILLDDGFQRRDIEKDLEIACEAPAIFQLPGDKFLNRIYRPFPAGLLREPISELNRADALCYLTAGESPDVDTIGKWKKYFEISTSILEWRIGCTKVIRDNTILPVTELTSSKPFLFAGIGSFDRLLEMVSALPFEITGSHQFDDHFVYDSTDLDMIRDMANDSGADCYLTTEKDLVKFPDYTFDRPVYALRLSVTPVDETAIGFALEKVM